MPGVPEEKQQVGDQGQGDIILDVDQPAFKAVEPRDGRELLCCVLCARL